MSEPGKAAAVSVEATSLANLLFLARRARAATTLTELAFIAVNETHQLTPYRQAALWWKDRGVFSLSGVSAIEANAPYTLWLSQLAQMQAEASATQPQVHAVLIDPASLPDALTQPWLEWWPEQAVWVGLPSPDAGGWLLAREERWHPSELALLEEWAQTWHHAWQALNAKSQRSTWRRWANKASDVPGLLRTVGYGLSTPFRPSSYGRGLGTLGHALAPTRVLGTFADLWRKPARRYGLLVLLLLCLPVRLTVLAPAELVAAHPAVIRSPQDGVVDAVLVQPNDRVKTGQALFTLERSGVDGRRIVAAQALAAAQAEYRQHAQQALFDPKSKARLALLQSTIAERQADLAYLQQQSERATLTAPHDGIVLYDAPTEWVGRPVVTGERIATVAIDRDEEIEAWLAPSDMIDLPPGASVTFYLNATPLDPLQATVRYVHHSPEQRPDGSFAYRMRAQLNAHSPRARLGLKGSAKVSGESVSLAYWILRRPLAVARQMLGI